MSVIMKAQFLLSRLWCVTEEWKKLGLIYQEACFLVLFSKAPSKARNIFFFIDLATSELLNHFASLRSTFLS